MKHINENLLESIADRAALEVIIINNSDAPPREHTWLPRDVNCARYRDLNRSRQLFVYLSAGEKWQAKHDAVRVLVIRVKQDEQLFSKLEEAVIISKKDKVVQKRVSKL